MAFKQPKKLEAGELREYAIRQLTARALSVGDLKAKLRQRAARVEDVDEVVAALKEAGALNDTRFAEHFSARRAVSGAYGKQRVMVELMKRRVAGKVAEKAVAEAFEGQDEVALIEGWLERKYRNQDLGALLQEPAKLAGVYRRLRQAGFATGPAVRVLKRFAAQAEELEGLEESEG